MISSVDKAAPTLAVLILAGGQSSRMGQDKALLIWQGIPLLQRVCRLAQQMTATVQVLSPWPERYQSLLPDGVSAIQENKIGHGPLWALAQGLEQSQADWVLLLACDLPLLEAAYLQNWRSQLSTLPNSCLACIPQTQSPPKETNHQETAQNIRWEPLCGFYRCESLGSLRSFLDQGGQSFQRWLREIAATPIALTAQEEVMLFNCNTPEDWRRLEKQMSPSPFN